MAGEGVEGPEGAVKVEQDHLVGDAAGVGAGRVADRPERSGNGLVLAQVGEDPGLGGGAARGKREDLRRSVREFPAP